MITALTPTTAEMTYTLTREDAARLISDIARALGESDTVTMITHLTPGGANVFTGVHGSFGAARATLLHAAVTIDETK